MPATVVVVGDPLVGKSHLLSAIQNMRSTSDDHWVAPVLNTFSSLVLHKGFTKDVNFWDITSDEEHDRLRPLSYPGTDVFLICFALNNKDSFQNVYNKWLPELLTYCPHAQRIVVGLKLDQARHLDRESLIKYDQDASWEAARSWPAIALQKKMQHRIWRMKRVLPIFRRHISPRFPPKDGRCMFNNVCNEILVLIFSFLNTPDLGRLAQVNKHFSNIVADAIVWRLRDKRIYLTKDQEPLTIFPNDISMLSRDNSFSKMILVSSHSFSNIENLKDLIVETCEAGGRGSNKHKRRRRQRLLSF